MAFTSSTPISAADISYDPFYGGLGRVFVYSDEDPRQLWENEYADGPPASGSTSAADLAAIQEHYAENDGFVDADGNAIEITLSHAPPSVLDHTELEENGLPNPFIDGSLTRIANLRKVRGAFMTHASTEEDETSGRTDISTSGGIKVEAGVAASGEVTQGLGDWIAEQISDTSIRLRIAPRPGETFDFGSVGVPGTQVADDVRVRAMVVAMQGWLRTGNDLYDSDNPLGDIEDWSVTIFNGRTFRFDQNIDPGVLDQFAFTVASTSAGAGQCSMIIQRESGTNDVHAGLVNAMLDDTSVTVSTGEDAEEDMPPLSTAGAVEAERIVMPDGEIYTENGILTFKSTREGVRRIAVGASYGEIANWGELSALSGTIARGIPKIHDLKHIIVDEAHDRSIRLPDPPDLVPFQGAIHDIAIECGESSDTDLTLYNADGSTELLTLKSGEICSLRWEWFDNGNGQIRSLEDILRTLEVAADDVGDFNDVGYWEESGGYWARPFLWPSAGEQTQDLSYHEDAFELGTDTITNGEDMYGESLHVPGSIKLLKDGRLRHDFQAVVSGASSGQVSTHFGRLIRQRGTSETGLISLPLRNLTVNETVPWLWLYEDEGDHVRVDDVFCPIYVYSKSSTMNPSNVRVVSMRLAITLFHSLLEEYTA